VKPIKEVVIRPMLAHSEPINPATYPIPPSGVWVSPKLDGVRCMQMACESKSRKLLNIPNLFVQKMLANPDLDGLDGELVVGLPTAPNCINVTTSGVMTIAGYPDFTYYVFDIWDKPSLGFRRRYAEIKHRVANLKRRGFPVALVPQTLCFTNEEAEAAIGAFYEAGYEGGIVRSYNDRYKYNRSTLNEGYLLKVKESVDAEARIVDFIEMNHNDNEATVNELGLTKRSTHKDNKRGAGTLGRMVGIDLVTGDEIKIGPGKMTAEEKLHVWMNKELYRNKISKYRYGKHGVKDKPRFPRHIVWRDPIDV